MGNQRLKDLLYGINGEYIFKGNDVVSLRIPPLTIIILGILFFKYIKFYISFPFGGIVICIKFLLLYISIFKLNSKKISNFILTIAEMFELCIYIEYKFIKFWIENINRFSFPFSKSQLEKFVSYMDLHKNDILYNFIIYIIIELIILYIFEIINIYVKERDAEKLNLNWMIIIMHHLTNNLVDLRYLIKYLDKGNEKENKNIALKKCEFLGNIIAKTNIVLDNKFINHDNWETISINEIINYIKNYKYKNNGDKGIIDVRNTSKKYISGEDCYIYVHRKKLRVIIDEILDNAIKHKYQNSNVIVMINFNNSHIHIDFYNEIAGDSDYVLEKIKILDEFWRNSSTSNISIDKVPLGLASIRYITENLRGQVLFGFGLNKEKFLNFVCHLKFYKYNK